MQSNLLSTIKASGEHFLEAIMKNEMIFAVD
jgi:hypothetical protein